MTIRLDLTLPPVDAMAFFRAKGLQPSFAWMDMLHQEHDAAFTVAKMMDVDLLRDMRSAVDDAIAEGLTLQDFRRQIQPKLMDAGWWGQAEMVDPLTGDTRLVQLGSPRRLRVIFETNMRTAYAAGHWAQIADQAADAPYLLYDAVDDGRTRPEHEQWDGKAFPVGDTFWEQWFPPNGWGCRCSVIQIDEEQLRELGKSGPDTAPPTPTRQWINPRTGEVQRVPTGIDPGWAYHPGRSRTPNLRERLSESIQTLDAGERRLAAPLLAARKAVPLTDALSEGRRISDELLEAVGGAPVTAATVRERIAQRLRREIGQPVTAATASRGKAATLVQDAGKRMPRDWVEAANDHGPLYTKSTVGRGSHYTVTAAREGPARLAGFGRVDAVRGSGYIVAGNARTALHEYAHRLQHVMPEIDDYFQQLHVRRTAGKPLLSLRALKGRGYRASEKFRDGGYVHPYMGKEYAQTPGLSYRGRAGALEMMPMSFEYLLARDEADFFLFKELDRELFDLAVWLLFHVGPGGPR